MLPPRNRLQVAVLFTTMTTPVVLGQKFHTQRQTLQLELKCSLILALNSLSGDTQPTGERFKGFHPPPLYKAPTSRRGLKQCELEGENHAMEPGDFKLSTIIMIA